MNIAVLKETRPGERRVALVPETGKKLIQLGYAVSLEAGAGEAAGYTDEAYSAVGVTVAKDPTAMTGAADVIFMNQGQSAGAEFNAEDLPNVYWDVEVDPGGSADTTSQRPQSLENMKWSVLRPDIYRRDWSEN